MKTIIHVNQHIIKANKKNGTNLPAITVKQGKTNTYAHTVDVLGPSRFVYSPNKPLSCGARLWCETKSQIIIDREVNKNELSFNACGV